LRHEARVLQLLQAHPAFPRLFGYVRAPHVEYLAIELLVPTVREKMAEKMALDIITVARVGLQPIRCPFVSPAPYAPMLHPLDSYPHSHTCMPKGSFTAI
jgi:hypothetical protein